MAFCIYCGVELPEGVGFCPNCGASVEGTQIDDTIQEEIKGAVTRNDQKNNKKRIIGI